ALVSVLSDKVSKDRMVVIDKIVLKDAKTKEMDSIFKIFKLNIKTHEALDEKGKKVVKVSKAAPKILLVVDEKDEMLVRAAKNIPYVKTIASNLINVYDVVVADKCVCTVDAIKKIEEAYKA
ncbi:MAG: 50S ribosomal protein L4, partial [Firmicutes bacterium]|nr:50S ribosomal protein L4 [Bacillota bacterium]